MPSVSAKRSRSKSPAKRGRPTKTPAKSPRSGSRSRSPRRYGVGPRGGRYYTKAGKKVYLKPTAARATPSMGVGRGGRVRGWKEAAPKGPTQRREMMARCGKSCFLEPKTLGFPVCAKGTCAVDCRGVVAAKARAAQYKHQGAYNRAVTLMKSSKCM